MLETYLPAVILGVIQGLTEFIPVSSSGHLVIAHALMGDVALGSAFDAVLHLATLLAILIYFRGDWWQMLTAWRSPVRRSTLLNRRLLWLIILASIPAGVFGAVSITWVDANFRSLTSVAILMLIMGVGFLISSRLIKSINDLNRLTWPKALAIGLAQALAIIPGISRSGMTIVAGMYVGLRREVAARFSFLLAAPIIAGAGLWSLYTSLQSGSWANGQYLFWLVAFTASLLSGLLAIQFLMSFLKQYSLNVFAYYLLVVGTGLLVYHFFF